MRFRLCVVLGMLSFASSAGAQDVSQHWARCLNEQEAITADQSIEGCTAVVQAARDVPANMAISTAVPWPAWRMQQLPQALADPVRR